MESFLHFLAQMTLPREIATALVSASTGGIAWILVQIHKMGQQVARIEQSLDDLKKTCPRTNGKDCE
jgi:hypothetical protein